MSKSFKARMEEIGKPNAKGGSPTACTPSQVNLKMVNAAFQNASVAVKFADVLMAINYLYAKYPNDPDVPEIRASPKMIEKLYQGLGAAMENKEWDLFATFRWADSDMIRIISENLDLLENQD